MDEKTKNNMKTIEQMIQYRKREIAKGKRNEWAQKRYQAELDALEDLEFYAKEALSARGIHA